MKIRNDLLAGKTGFLQKILQFFGDYIAFKPLRPNAFRVFSFANILQFAGGLSGIGPVNNCGSMGKRFPALDVVAQSHS